MQLLKKDRMNTPQSNKKKRNKTGVKNETIGSVSNEVLSPQEATRFVLVIIIVNYFPHLKSYLLFIYYY